MTSHLALIPTPQGPGAAWVPQRDANSNPAPPYMKSEAGEALLGINPAEHGSAPWQRRGHYGGGQMQNNCLNLPQLPMKAPASS